MSTEQPPHSESVGYRKPPKRTRFQKGQSGNPKGRPKGSPNFVTALEQVLGEKVVVNEGGQRRIVTKMVASITQFVNKAAMGDPRAIQQLFKVAPLLDDKPSENQGAVTAEPDAAVIANLMNRMRRTLKGDEHEPDQA